MSRPTPEAAASPPRRPWAAWLARRPRRRLFASPEGVVDLDAPGTEAVDLPGWFAGHPHCTVEIVLSGRLVHTLLVKEPALVRADAADRQAWARQQVMHFHGAEAGGWPLVVAADAPMLAVSALHGGDLDGWRAGAAQHRVRLARVVPCWSVAPARVARAWPGWPGDGHAALMLVEGSHATWLRFEDGRLEVIEQRLAAAPEGDALARLARDWQQEARIGPERCAIVGFGLRGAVDGLALQGRLLGDPRSRHVDPEWIGS